MIPQRSNSPLICKVPNTVVPSSMADISAVLVHEDDVVKHWGISDVEIEGQNVSLPLTQEETGMLEDGMYIVELKFWNSDGEVIPFHSKTVTVEKRADTTIFTEV